MSLSELRAELKLIRKELTPVSRMKKADVVRELERTKTRAEKVEVVADVLVKAKVPKKVIEKVKAVEEVVEKKTEILKKKKSKI